MREEFLITAAHHKFRSAHRLQVALSFHEVACNRFLNRLSHRLNNMNPPDQQGIATEATIESIQQALNDLLHQLAPALSKKSEVMASDPMSRIEYCMTLVKSEASLAASLIADCAPQGRPMLAQAQQTLKSLESLQRLGKTAIKA